jgi:tripeptide aminopeptidase
MAHLDTVPLCVGAKPIRRGKRIRSADRHTGLGADNRAGTAVVLYTALTLLQQDLPRPPLTFLWTVQEEVGLKGARYLRLGMLGRPRMAFNWDGGDPAKITIGATGGYRMEISIRGLASHAGNAPEKGVSAIAVAALAIADLTRNGWHGQVIQPEGPGTSNVGIITGGSATNVVADHVRVMAEARSHQPVVRRQIVQQIKNAFQRAAREITNTAGRTARVKLAGRLDYEAFCLPTNHPCVLAASRAIRAAGHTPELAVANGGLDANWMTARGIPTVSLGCGQLHQHTTDEALDVGRFESACRIARLLATEEERTHESG